MLSRRQGVTAAASATWRFLALLGCCYGDKDLATPHKHVRANFLERTSFLKMARSIEAIKRAPRPAPGSIPVVLVTYMFGPKSARLPYLPAVFKTLSMAAVDCLIIGDARPPFELPPHVSHYQISFRDLGQLASKKLFNGRPLSKMFSDRYPEGNHYKVIDYKPMTGLLFGDLLDKYAWWGHIDNDMLFGDIRRFLTDELLLSNDALFALPKAPPLDAFMAHPLGREGENIYRTWGPIQLYRNTDKINRLFTKVGQGELGMILNSTRARFFDEWGGNKAVRATRTDKFANLSMTYLVNRYQGELGLRFQIFNAPIFWDGGCIYDIESQIDHDPPSTECNMCVLSTMDSGRNVLVAGTGKHTDGRPYKLSEFQEVIACHFQVGASVPPRL